MDQIQTPPPGSSFPLIDEIKDFSDKNYPVHHNMSGMYTARKGMMRHLIVLCIGYGNDWTVYEGWASLDMSVEDALKAIRQSGDKIYDKRAKELLDEYIKNLKSMHYR